MLALTIRIIDAGSSPKDIYMKKTLTAVAVVAALSLSACGGGGDRPSKDELSKALSKKDNGLGTTLTKKQADCVAGAIVDSEALGQGAEGAGRAATRTSSRPRQTTRPRRRSPKTSRSASRASPQRDVGPESVLSGPMCVHSRGSDSSSEGVRPVAARIQTRWSPISGSRPVTSTYAWASAPETAARERVEQRWSLDRRHRAGEVVAVHDQLDHPGEDEVVAGDRAARTAYDVGAQRVERPEADAGRSCRCRRGRHRRTSGPAAWSRRRSRALPRRSRR